MAINFNGGSDRVGFGSGGLPNTGAGCMVMWVKTTGAVSQTGIYTIWQSTARNGIALLVNWAGTGGTNKIAALNWNASVEVASKASTTTINDGAWHHVAWNYSQANGGTNEMFVDGSSQGTVNNSAAWTYNNSGDGRPVFGDSNATFLAALVGDLAECALFNRSLSAAEIVALAKGAPVMRLRPLLYCPFLRDHHNLLNGFVQDFSGTTFSAHPPIRRAA